MVKNFIHILRTYLITFRYIKKNEIYSAQLIALFIVYSFIISVSYLFLLNFINKLKIIMTAVTDLIMTPESIFRHTNSTVLNTQYSSLLDLTSNSIMHGIDWLFSYVETISLYDYKVLYFWFYNSIFDDSYDFYFISC